MPCLNPYPIYRCQIPPGFSASRLNVLANTNQWKTVIVSCLNPYPVYRCKIYVFQVFGLTKFVRPNNGSSPSLQPILDRWIGCRSTYSVLNHLLISTTLPSSPFFPPSSTSMWYYPSRELESSTSTTTFC